MSPLKLTIQTYLNKFSNTTKLIQHATNNLCRQIIVIPAYCETEIEKTLDSLLACIPTKFTTEVIIVLNSSKEDNIEVKFFHEKQQKVLEQKYGKEQHIIFHVILTSNLPSKHAGVGLARKIGMDEAIRRFQEIDFDGLLICLDADCIVSKNYLVSLEEYACKPQNYNTICLHFEHALETEKDDLLKRGIIFYELFLRYYKECLSYSGFPYACHTIGSSMAVKASTYCKAGGMNKRKAGEDFYFLTKVFSLGKVIELNSVTVYPSARISTRVPFGTGRAQQNFLQQKENVYTTYAFQIFEDLRSFFLTNLYTIELDTINFPIAITAFLESVNFKTKLIELKNNTASLQQFQKRFFDWFDGFMVLKFVHFARDNYYSNNLILEEVKALFLKKEINYKLSSEKEQLIYLRQLQTNTYQ